MIDVANTKGRPNRQGRQVAVRYIYVTFNTNRYLQYRNTVYNKIHVYVVFAGTSTIRATVWMTRVESLVCLDGTCNATRCLSRTSCRRSSITLHLRHLRRAYALATRANLRTARLSILTEQFHFWLALLPKRSTHIFDRVIWLIASLFFTSFTFDTSLYKSTAMQFCMRRVVWQ